MREQLRVKMYIEPKAQCLDFLVHKSVFYFFEIKREVTVTVNTVSIKVFAGLSILMAIFSHGQVTTEMNKFDFTDTLNKRLHHYPNRLNILLD